MCHVALHQALIILPSVRLHKCNRMQLQHPTNAIENNATACSIPKKLEEAGVEFSECAKGHVAAKPKAGDAVLFYS